MKKEIQIYLNYAYLGILFTLTQIFDSLYAVQITSEFSINGGDIAYCSLIFTTMYLMLTQPEPKIVRNLIQINIIQGVILFLLFYLVNSILDTYNITNFLNISSLFLDFSIKSLLLSYFLYAFEIILALVLIKRWKKMIKNRFLIIIFSSVVYASVMLLDGIFYPIIYNLIFPGSSLSIINSIFGKLVFGLTYGSILVIILKIRPKNFSNFINEKNPIKNYILTPREKELKEKLANAEKEIQELKEIIPICANCKKIRDDQGYWNQLEEFLKNHKNIVFTHGLCPNCADDMIDQIKQ